MDALRLSVNGAEVLPSLRRALAFRARWCIAVLVALLILAATSSAQQGSLADRLKAVHSGHAETPPVPLPAWKPMANPSAAPAIPIVQGLVEDFAVNVAGGDYESLLTIQSLSRTTITATMASDTPNIGSAVPTQGSGSEKPQMKSATRMVDVADIATAHAITQYFRPGQTEHFPGTTPFTGSTELVNQLRAGRGAEFYIAAVPDKLAEMGLQLPKNLTGQPTAVIRNGLRMYACNLQRVEPVDVAIPVLVNDQRVELPALHGKCTMDNSDEAHFYFLDQPSSPLILAMQISARDSRAQVIKITFPPPARGSESSAAPGIEKELAANQAVQLYGIYFDFNSATIRPESTPVLEQIAAILADHPAWKLSVSGHTDNIGEDSFNLALSQRRAAAVKEALVTQYHIAAPRLIATGYGASRPIESNATTEGRARNRRVELQRQ